MSSALLTATAILYGAIRCVRVDVKVKRSERGQGGRCLLYVYLTVPTPAREPRQVTERPRQRDAAKNK